MDPPPSQIYINAHKRGEILIKRINFLAEIISINVSGYESAVKIALDPLKI